MGEETVKHGPLGLLALESGVPAATQQALADLGWKLSPTPGEYFFGRYQCIERMERGGQRVYAAGSEVRADGTALAY